MKIRFLLITLISLLTLSGCSSNTELSPELEGEIKGMMNGVSVEESAENIEEEILNLTNEYRKSNGLSELVMDKTLNNIAAIRAEEIVDTWSHTRPDGSSYIDLIVASNFECKLAGENLARYQISAEQLLEQWKNSESHNANLLGDFTKIGIAMYEENGLMHFVQIFTK